MTGVDSEGNDIYKEIEIDLAGTVSKSVYSMKVDSTGQVLTDSDDDGNVEIDFGSVAATGNTTDGSQTFVKVLTFNVNGQTPINIDSISIDGAGYYLLDSNGNIVTDNVIDTFSGSDNVILNSGDKIYIRVMFDIDSLGSGLREGELKISGSQNITYDLTANVVEADIELVDTEAQFENTLIGQKSSVFVTVRNTGDSNLVIDGFTCEDTQFSLAKDTITIAPGQEQEVEIYYEPSTLYTTVTDFYLNTNDPDESSVAVALTGVSGGNVLEPSVSAGNNYVYVFNNANGKRVTLLISYTTADSLTKAGTSEPVVYLDRAGDSGNISMIEMPDSLASSRIIVSGNVSIGDIYAGSLSSIVAVYGTLDGDVNVSGTLGLLRVSGIEEGSHITVDNANEASTAMTVLAGTIAENTVFDLDVNVQTFQANDYKSGSLTANNINALVIRTGDLGAVVDSANDIRIIRVADDIEASIFAGDDITLLYAGGDITADSLVVAGVPSSETRALSSSSGSIGTVLVGGDIDGDLRALDGDIGRVLASRGDINGGIYANNLNMLYARNINKASMAINGSINSFQVRYDVIDSVIGVGYDFSSLESSSDFSGAAVQAIVDLDNPISANPVRVYRIGGEVSDSSLSFLF